MGKVKESKATLRSKRNAAWRGKSTAAPKHSGRRQSADAKITARIRAGEIGALDTVFSPQAMRERNQKGPAKFVVKPVEVSDEHTTFRVASTMPVVGVATHMGWGKMTQDEGFVPPPDARKRGMYHLVAVPR